MQRRELLTRLGAGLLTAAVPVVGVVPMALALKQAGKAALPCALPPGLVPPGDLTVLGPDAALVILRCPHLSLSQIDQLRHTLQEALPPEWQGRVLVLCGPTVSDVSIEALDETAMHHAGWVCAETKHHV